MGSLCKKLGNQTGTNRGGSRVIFWRREQVWKRKADYAEKLRGMCRSRDGLVVWRFWIGYRTFFAAPVASQTVAVGIREFGFEEVTERD